MSRPLTCRRVVIVLGAITIRSEILNDFSVLVNDLIFRLLVVSQIIKFWFDVIVDAVFVLRRKCNGIIVNAVSAFFIVIVKPRNVSVIRRQDSGISRQVPIVFIKHLANDLSLAVRPVKAHVRNDEIWRISLSFKSNVPFDELLLFKSLRKRQIERDLL